MAKNKMVPDKDTLYYFAGNIINENYDYIAEFMSLHQCSVEGALRFFMALGIEEDRRIDDMMTKMAERKETHDRVDREHRPRR